MLEFYFSYRGVLKRLRSGALGDEMDRIAERFLSLGYKRVSAKIYLSRIARFSRFAAMRCGSMSIGQNVIDSYLRRFSTDSPRIAAVSALGHARRVSGQQSRFEVELSRGDLGLGAGRQFLFLSGLFHQRVGHLQAHRIHA